MHSRSYYFLKKKQGLLHVLKRIISVFSCRGEQLAESRQVITSSTVFWIQRLSLLLPRSDYNEQSQLFGELTHSVVHRSVVL